MSKIFLGNLDPRTDKRDLEEAFGKFGVIRDIWVARSPPGTPSVVCTPKHILSISHGFIELHSRLENLYLT